MPRTLDTPPGCRDRICLLSVLLAEGINWRTEPHSGSRAARGGSSGWRGGGMISAGWGECADGEVEGDAA